VTNRYLILISTVLATTLFTATILVASTLLPQMQGAMLATQDEIAWTMTFNILATAVVTPMAGWLAARFGRRSVMVWCSLGFTFATLMCGAAGSLEELVFWRILQGGIGAPLVPLSQTILLDTFPREQHGMVISIYGMSAVIGPVIGPALGGLLSDIYSWRWAFYMMVLPGALVGVALRFVLPPDDRERTVPFDWFGFLSLSTAIACLQLALSRGQRLDWFQSMEIIIEVLLSVLALYIFIVHSMTAKAPFLSPRLVRDRNFLLGMALVWVYGMLNFTPIVLLPALLQQHAGFPDTLLGEMTSWRGVGSLAGFFVAGFFGRLDPRFGMTLGFSLQVASGLWLMSIDLNVNEQILALNSILQGLAVGIIWVPLTVATFATLDPELRAEGTAVYHLMRNVGSSFFISLSVAEIVRSTGINYARLVEIVSPYNRTLAMPWAMGQWDVETAKGLARLSKEITRQSAMIGYLNAFGMYTAMSALAVPLIMLVRRARAEKNAPA
jgi:DHA2 family multidrug resistance protein